MKGFNPKSIIKTPEHLYGRSELLSQLKKHLSRNNIVQIIGLRRFGKTSLLKCLEFEILNSNDIDVIPVYVDFKTEASAIKGTANVYRYLSARICELMVSDGELDEPLAIRNVSIPIKYDWVDFYEHFQSCSPVKIQVFFRSLVEFFSEKTNKCFYLLIDEYEFLFRNTFDTPEGFMPLRGFTTERNNYGNHAFGFIISGAITFNYLCTITGSGELNVVTDTLYVGPIEKEPFEHMWTNECRRAEVKSREIIDGLGYIYSSSGGVPFYAKILAEMWIISGSKPNYSKLIPYFEEIYNSFSREEKSLLHKILEQDSPIEHNLWIESLLNKGVIQTHPQEKGIYQIPSTFLKKYLSSKMHQLDPHKNEINVLREITSKIFRKIKVINDCNRNKNKSVLFLPTDEDSILYEDLSSLCLTEDALASFSGALYKIMFEKTKSGPKGKSMLPNGYKKNNKFINTVDIMRHSLGKGHLMATFKVYPGKMSKPEMLEFLTGSKNEPTSSSEYLSIQKRMLEMFDEELDRLTKLVKAK